MKNKSNYLTLFLIGWSIFQFLGFLFQAYPATQNGILFVLGFLFLILMIIALIELSRTSGTAIQNYRSYLPFLKAIGVFLVILVPFLAGIYIGVG